MAITQQRMENLVLAALAYKTQTATITKTLHSQIAALPPSPTPEQLLELIQIMQNCLAITQINSEHAETIAREHEHIRLTKNKNRRIAEYMRRKRATDPAIKPAPHTAPHKLGEKTVERFFVGQATAQTSELAKFKLAQNDMASTVNMPAPYPQWQDDTIPLLPEHIPVARHKELLEGKQILQTTPTRQVNTRQVNTRQVAQPASTPSALSIRKRAINAQHLAVNMPAPYTNPDDDTEGLLPDHSPDQLTAMGDAELF